MKIVDARVKHRGKHSYVTHMNGGRPYVVYIGEDVVTVYTVPAKVIDGSRGWPESKDSYTKLVKKIGNVSKKFIPKYKKIDDFNASGNTILVKSGREYVHVGDGIFSFKSELGDEIQKYFSPIGNSDVPYPIAVGKSHVYMVCEKTVIKKSLFPKGISWEDEAVEYYYEHFLSNTKDVTELSGLKIVAVLPQ